MNRLSYFSGDGPLVHEQICRWYSKEVLATCIQRWAHLQKVIPSLGEMKFYPRYKHAPIEPKARHTCVHSVALDFDDAGV